MGSTSDKIKGKTNEVAGKARQAVGKAADNQEEQAKGSVQKVAPLVKAMLLNSGAAGTRS